MKKLLVSLTCLLLCTSIAFAEETVATQDVNVDCSGIALVVNKQPENTAIKQTVQIRRSGLIFVVNVNGKVELPENNNK